jgi:hypothetical protein
MTSRKDAGKSLVDFTDDVGIPERLVTDGATEFTGRHTEFVKKARQMRIMLHSTEQGCKNQNDAAEREIGVMEAKDGKKERTQMFMGLRTCLRKRVALCHMARGSD